MVDGLGPTACVCTLPGRSRVRPLANVPEGGARWERVGAGDEKNEQANILRLPSTMPEHKQEGRANTAASEHGLKMRAHARALRDAPPRTS